MSNFNIEVGESLFPLIYEDRLLCSRVPNKYLEKSKQHQATFETSGCHHAYCLPLGIL